MDWLMGVAFTIAVLGVVALGGLWLATNAVLRVWRAAARRAAASAEAD